MIHHLLVKMVGLDQVRDRKILFHKTPVSQVQPLSLQASATRATATR